MLQMRICVLTSIALVSILLGMFYNKLVSEKNKSKSENLLCPYRIIKRKNINMINSLVCSEPTINFSGHNLHIVASLICHFCYVHAKYQVSFVFRLHCLFRCLISHTVSPMSCWCRKLYQHKVLKTSISERVAWAHNLQLERYGNRSQRWHGPEVADVVKFVEAWKENVGKLPK